MKSLLVSSLTLLGCLAAGAGATAQQAWLPPKGEASFSLGFSHLFASTHVDYQGTALAPGDMTWNNVASDLGYGITDRMAVRATLPFVISKYDGKLPHPPAAGHTNLDDGAWHSTFQDFRGEVRVPATRRCLVVHALGDDRRERVRLRHAVVQELRQHEGTGHPQPEMPVGSTSDR